MSNVCDTAYIDNISLQSYLVLRIVEFSILLLVNIDGTSMTQNQKQHANTKYT